MLTIDNEIEKFLTRKFTAKVNTEPNDITTLNLYFRNQMSTQYKQVEDTLKKIIYDNAKPINENHKLQLHIYYKTTKLKNLFIKNNPHSTTKSNVVYRYTCNNRECQQAESYIGYTECELVDRLRNHTQLGAILNHNLQKHNSRITTREIQESTKIIRHHNQKDELLLAEALLIKIENPTLNRQNEGEARILAIF